MAPEPRKGDCVLPYVDFPDNEPVFLNNRYRPIEPKGKAIHLKHWEMIILACPGSSNSLVFTSEKITPLNCVHGKTLDVMGKKVHLSALSCHDEVRGNEKRSKGLIRCAENRGIYVGLGHQVASMNFQRTFIACYDFTRGAPIYAEHIIFGSAIDHRKMTLSGRQLFNDTEKQTTQLAIFTSYFGKSFAEQYIKPGSYLVGGHLAPDDDFVYMTSRWPTYFAANTVPQWHQINNQNWKTLEVAIKIVAAHAETEFKVVTGSSDSILTLQGRELYVAKLSVPNFVWKIIVTSNHPFDPKVRKICPDISKDYGWYAEDFEDYQKGLTFACEIEKLRRVVPLAPSFTYKNIL